MKIQNLAIIFAIIILPIMVAVSIFVNIQKTTLSLQTSYDTKLHNATHDAIVAFQLNETNSNTQNIATEKIRDVEASIETFYNSLAMALNLDAYGEGDLGSYIPALAYTLYDGYYIYSSFNNISKVDGSGNPKYERGLKPFIYYSARYVKGGIDVTVNYTLDNYVTIYGTVPGEGYITKAGYLINPTDVTSINDVNKTLKYKGQLIEPETLKENLAVYENGEYVFYDAEYIYLESENNQRKKVYRIIEPDGTYSWYELLIDRRLNKITRQSDIDRINNRSKDGKDISAYYYYTEAQKFSEWVKSNLGDIQLKHAKGYEANEEMEKNIYFISNSKVDDYIFKLSEENDPEIEKSVFNDHRRNVIKYAIQTNLISAIGGYNQISQVNNTNTTYNFRMPVLTEEDWDNVLNNVSIISFMQGFPIKGDVYNGYSIVTNNKNREFIDPRFMYFISDSETEYHSIYDYTKLSSMSNIVAYRNIDYARKRVAADVATTPTTGIDTGNSSQYYYSYPQYACYDCIITTSTRQSNEKTYDLINKKEKTIHEYIEGLLNMANSGDINAAKIIKAYYTALARERYSAYKSNKFETH